MSTLIVTVDDATEAGLQQMANQRHISIAEMASRLLRRAVRAAQLRPVYDVEALRAAYTKFAEEDLAGSEATVAEHRKLLEAEDKA